MDRGGGSAGTGSKGEENTVDGLSQRTSAAERKVALLTDKTAQLQSLISQWNSHTTPPTPPFLLSLSASLSHQSSLRCWPNCLSLQIPLLPLPLPPLP